MESILNIEFVNSQIFWTAVCFFILLGVVWRYAVPSIAGAIDERAAKIREDLDRADSLKREAEKLLKQYEAQIKAAQGEAAEIVSTARKESEDIIVARTAKMEADLARKAAEAEKSIEQARNLAVEQLRGEVATLVLEASQKVVEAELDSKKAAKFTDEMLSRMAS